MAEKFATNPVGKKFIVLSSIGENFVFWYDITSRDFHDTSWYVLVCIIFNKFWFE